MTDPRLANGQAAAGSSSGAQSSGDASYDPKQDPAVFTPDGVIVFPRSDGDPKYGPPNTDAPPPSVKDVNYFHIFEPSDPKYQRWSAVIGEDLARWAGKPDRAPSGKRWRILAFPKDYYFTEQRKGPKHSYRTDPYLFGSNAHRFRSTKEFLHHAQWLISDPTLNPAKCECKYCTHSKTAIPTPGGPSRRSEAASRAAKQPRQSLPSKKAPNLNAVRIRTQQLPPPNSRVEVGVVVPSVPARDADLSRASLAGKDQCEGYRVGEIVWVKLANPISDPQKPARIIDMWPALISEVLFTTHIAPPQTPTDPRRANANPQTDAPLASSDAPTHADGSASLRGRVRQERMHDIVLFGAPADRGRVGEDRLRPFLAGFVNEDVKRSNFGKYQEHTWLDREGGAPPKLFLLESRPTSVPPVKFSTVVAALAYSMTALSYVRCRYLATNPFEIPEGARVLPPPTAAHKEDPSTPNGPSTPMPTAGPSAAPVTYPPAPYASTASTGSSTAEGHDSEIRPGLADRKLSASAIGNGSPASRTGPVKYKPGYFYQGIQAGVERVWVGDMVRLSLREKEVKDMFESIAAEKKLERKSDANDGFNTRGSYVMRVRAFMEENRKLRAAGRVYEIMAKPDFEAKKAKEKALYDAKAEKDAASGDPFGGMGRPFAFPAMGVLTAAGKELPATPHLAEGFFLSPINRDSHEVVVDLVNVAGRLWPSLSQDDDVALVQDYNAEKIPYSQALDCEVPEWSRVSLAGGLPGFVKPMNLEARERGDRDELMKACFEISRQGVRSMIRDAITSEGGYVPPDPSPPAAEDATASTAIDGGSSAMPTHPSPARSSGDVGQKRKAQDSPSANSHHNGSSPAKRPAVISGTPSGAVGSAKSSVASAASSPSASTPVGRSSVAQAQHGKQASSTSSSASVAPSSPATSMTQDRGESPPLPPGWVKKVSKNGYGVYYANPKTKKTSWDRPTE